MSAARRLRRGKTDKESRRAEKAAQRANADNLALRTALAKAARDGAAQATAVAHVSCMLALRDEFKFGSERMTRAFEKARMYSRGFRSGEFCLEDARESLAAEMPERAEHMVSEWGRES